MQCIIFYPRASCLHHRICRFPLVLYCFFIVTSSRASFLCPFQQESFVLSFCLSFREITTHPNPAKKIIYTGPPSQFFRFFFFFSSSYLPCSARPSSRFGVRKGGDLHCTARSRSSSIIPRGS
ncbi:hypothetical protein F4806DRAFT_461746 [Annulohypoxylon nitens]|nr:hypothetical protein F4806DRAFT_461746 [Annulohypoxylon nitens]